MTTATATKPALRPDRLYFGDNGRLFCGELHCAGSSAHFSGYTISGQKVVPLTAAQGLFMKGMGCEPKCEGCGKGA